LTHRGHRDDQHEGSNHGEQEVEEAAPRLPDLDVDVLGVLRETVEAATCSNSVVPAVEFPCVCPEPVLVKCSFLDINGAKSGVFW
jgi:hypothetical protein